jgi:hypothetical protein
MKDTLLDKQDRQCTHNVTLRRLRLTIVAAEKISILYSGISFVVLVFYHAMRMCRVVMCVLSASALFFYVIS